MPWVHASPHDLWQVVPSDSHPTIQRPPFSPIQPQTHSRRNASVLPEYPLPQVIARASESSAPKAIGSERKLRLLQQQREQPMVDVVPTPEWNSGSIPTSSSRHTGTFPSRQAKRFGAAQSQVSSLSQPVSGSIPERPKHRTIPLPPQGLPTPPPTPPSTPSSPHLPIHAPAPTPIRTSALPLIHLPPAPQAHSDYQQTQELIQKYKSISKFNAHRFRHGTKWTPVPRFSSGLNPAREALGEVLGAKGKDFVDGERWEKERERERERELELERLGLGLGSGSSLGFGRKEKSWNYFRRAQSVGLRSRSVCERSHSRSASGGCVSVSAYLRGSDQKHCLGCRREGLRVRLLIVQLWRRNLWEGGSSMSTSATATPILDSDLDFDLGMRLGLEFLGSEFEFDDDEDDEDEDDVDVNVDVVGENGGLGRRFVMDHWDDDSSQVGLGRVKERKGSEQTETNRDIPMDVDSETDSFSGPRRLDEELMRAQMEVDSDDHNQVVVKAPETVWVGGVPDSPRLKDLDDFDM
ncbi:hypothetical protein E1B28_011572 [Marasmius oreades]|nr:uncharacterized protein E1B28_011572 [Marasmius oreades]KAG7089944.1 hypothetical protein E1B28_011572 [Marasmius oreades]